MAAESNLRGSTILNRYKLDGELAQGALCLVYRGEDVVLRRSVAVKAVPTERVGVYRDSLRTTASFTHPAVVATYDAIEQDGWLYLVQEFVSARPLSSYVTGGIPSERAVDLGGQIARALAYAHAHDLVHGDLTPAAVLIDRQAAVRVNNFGLPVDEAYFAEAAASVGEDALTPPAASVQADVMACGLLLWQVLTGPAGKSSAPAEHASTRRDFRQDVPEPVRELVRRCVLREYPQQIVDAQSLALELEGLAAELTSRRPAAAQHTPPALRIARQAVAREAAWSMDETVSSSHPWTAPDAEERYQPYAVPAGAERRQPVWPVGSSQVGEAQSQRRVSRPFNGAPPVRAQDVRAADRKMRSDEAGLSVMAYLLIFVGLFILFFLIGFILPYMLGHHS